MSDRLLTRTSLPMQHVKAEQSWNSDSRAGICLRKIEKSFWGGDTTPRNMAGTHTSKFYCWKVAFRRILSLKGCVLSLNWHDRLMAAVLRLHFCCRCLHATPKLELQVSYILTMGVTGWNGLILSIIIFEATNIIFGGRCRGSVNSLFHHCCSRGGINSQPGWISSS